MNKVSDFTWAWLDKIGWCDCTPRRDQCPVCKEKRAQQRAADQGPKVFTGRPAGPRPRKLDWEP